MGRNGSGVVIVDKWARGPRAGKRWQVRAWDPRKGTHHTRSFDDGQYEDGENWGKTQAAKYRTGAERIDRPLFKLIAAEYARELEDRGRSLRHVEEIRRVAKDVEAAGAEDMSSDSFSVRVRQWFTGLDKTLSAHTRNRYRTHLRAISRYARAAGHIQNDPMALIRRHTVKLPGKAVFTVDEMRTLSAPGAEPYWLPFALMAYTGCRHNEALHLRWDWIDWSAKRINVRIHQDYDLKRGKERAIPMQPELLSILAPLKQDKGWIVEDKRYRQTSSKMRWNHFRDYTTGRGVEMGKRSPHSTRHTWVSLVLATGENLFSVQEWAGHDTLMTTQGYSKAQSAFRDAVEGWPKGVLWFLPLLGPVSSQ